MSRSRPSRYPPNLSLDEHDYAVAKPKLQQPAREIKLNPGEEISRRSSSDPADSKRSNNSNPKPVSVSADNKPNMDAKYASQPLSVPAQRRRRVEVVPVDKRTPAVLKKAKSGAFDKKPEAKEINSLFTQATRFTPPSRAATESELKNFVHYDTTLFNEKLKKSTHSFFLPKGNKDAAKIQEELDRMLAIKLQQEEYEAYERRQKSSRRRK